MTYEYMTKNCSRGSSMKPDALDIDKLNVLGGQGWQVVDVQSHGWVLFMRQKEGESGG